MKNALKELKPKANKLYSLTTHWHVSDLSKNQELSLAIEALMEREDYPAPIQAFLKLPRFKQLIDTMKEAGYLLPNLKKDPAKLQKEIQTLQILIEAFHRLVHLDYSEANIEDPLIRVKILSQNIQDYLLCVDSFVSYEGEIVDEIVTYLFGSISRFTTELKGTAKGKPEVFSDALLASLELPFMESLLSLDRKGYKSDLMEAWYPITIELNLDPRLAVQKKVTASMAKANGHKLINQMQSNLSEMACFYMKNPPGKPPLEIQGAILNALSDKTISGQKVNELFYLEFWKEPYEVLLTKEKGMSDKCMALFHQLWPIKESLQRLTSEYFFALPEEFSRYLIEVVEPLTLGFSILGKPNFLGSQLSLGFYNSQYEFLNELLNEGDHEPLPSAIAPKLVALVPTLLSLLQSYYGMQPLTSFTTMKEWFENLFSGKEALESHSLETIKERIQHSFSLFTKKEDSSAELLEASLSKIKGEIESILHLVPKRSIEYSLLQEKFRLLQECDLPSYQQTWFIFGEFIGVLFIFFSYLNPLFSEEMHGAIDALCRYPFFQALFFPERTKDDFSATKNC